MALPHAAEARQFYQAAKQRFDDASFLLEAERTTGAIYLAGYSVECMLKALLLAVLPEGKLTEMAGSTKHGDAEAFLRTVKEIMIWADGRL